MCVKVALNLTGSKMAPAHLTHLIFVGTLSLLIAACNQETVRKDPNVVRLGSLSAEQALALSDRVKERARSRDLVFALRFVHYYKRNLRDPAFVALELVNHTLAREIVASVRERKGIEEELIEIDLKEGANIREEIERQQRMGECEREVSSGRFVPMTGQQFCILWDSGLLELLPFPSKILTGAARVAARRSLTRLPREQLRQRSPRMASIMTKYDGMRAVVHQRLRRHIEREEALARHLLDTQWNIITGLAVPDH